MADDSSDPGGLSTSGRSALFAVAAKRICEGLENVLYVGDRLDSDIDPTLKLGMHAALKAAHSNDGKKVPEGAWKITHVAELPELIEKHNIRSSSNEQITIKEEF